MIQEVKNDMLLKLLCAPFLGIVYGFINLIPILKIPVERTAGLVSMISTALNFFPADVWIMCLSTFTFWISVHLIVGLVGFVLGLIPFVNIHVD